MTKQVSAYGAEHRYCQGPSAIFLSAIWVYAEDVVVYYFELFGGFEAVKACNIVVGYD